MVMRIGGYRRKSRQKFTKHYRRKGKISLGRYFQTFEMGQKVLLDVEPAVQKGMYWPGFIGKTCVIKGIQGRCYKIEINDMGKSKTLIVHPVHLKKV